MSASRAGRTEPRKRPPALSLALQRGDGIAALPASRAQLRRWVAAAIDADAALTLRFVGEAEGRQLNHAYRGRDYPTNVLSFVYALSAEDMAPGAPGLPEVVADIVICLPVLEREARERNIPLAHHLAHLVIHGVLHACGHDHEHDEPAQIMQALETRLLGRFRIPDPYQG
ncbi:MAG: rRNA maturation RNase YbeY [Burkholderiaceae bacterium]